MKSYFRFRACRNDWARGRMSNVKNPQVQYLLKRMELVGSDEFTPSRGGRATIYFKDGTHATNTTYLLGHASLMELDMVPDVRKMTGKF